MLRAIKVQVHEKQYKKDVTPEQKLIGFQEESDRLHKDVMSNSIIQGGDTRPIALAISDKTFAVMFSADDDFDKDSFNQFVAQYCHENKMKKMFYISEVWYLAGNKDDKKIDGHTLPSESPNRKEGLLRVYFDLEAKTATSIMEDIVRSNGIITLVENVELSKQEGDEGFTGKMADMMFNGDLGDKMIMRELKPNVKKGKKNETIN